MFEMIRQVGTSSVDTYGILTVSSAVDFMQDCSIFHVDSMKNLSDYLTKQHIRIFIASRQINIFRMPKYGEMLKIKTWLFDCSRAGAYRNTVIYDSEENVCVASYTIGAFVNILSGKAVLMPKDLIMKVSLYNKFSMEYLDRRVQVPKTVPIKETPISVLKYHLDYNDHVNNSKYLCIACEYLKNDFNYRCVRIEYKTPAKYRDIIVPYIFNTRCSTVIDLCSELGNSFATVEFIS